MRRFNPLIILIAAALVASCAAPARNYRTATAQTGSGYECRQETVIGSRLPQYICRSEAQLEEERTYAQELLRRGDRVIIQQ